MDELAITSEAYNYVIEKSSVTKKKLDYYLNEWKCRKPNTINELFRNLLESAKNTGGMPNFIGNLEIYRSVLFDFNPKKVYNTYQNWEAVFDEINLKCQTPSPMNKSNKRNSWVKYTKSVIDSAKYMSRFDDVANFQVYTEQFVNAENIDLRIALPLIIKEEIYNIGFALACDFIKENISPKFIKPDVHINKIFRGIGICKESDSGYDIFRKVIIFSQKANQEPYWIDKLFWLIGSGKFYINKKYRKEEKFKSSREEFINLINRNK